jgi:hypothetical protein
MKNDHEKLITALVNDLKPVAKPAGFVMPFQLWLMMAVLFASGLAWLMGPYRPGALAQLAASLQFSVETVVGCIAITMIVFIAFRSAIPSGMTEFKQRVMPISLLFVWIGFYVYGIVDPALAESMAGKRDHCYLETMLFATLPLLVGLFWAKKLWPINKIQTGLLFGLASGGIAAMVMQFACMYEPMHALLFHILPGLEMGVIGAFLAKVIIKLD